MKQRTANIDLIQLWIAEHSIALLAASSDVSVETLRNILNSRRRHIPRLRLQIRIAEAMGRPLDEVFPPIKDEAS